MCRYPAWNYYLVLVLIQVNAGRLVIRDGLYIRLTRNLDKDRGFVNGAIGVIEVVLDADVGVFLLRLTTGTLVLVHPIVTDGVTHLPCAFGYATTIRRAQGSTLDAGCLFFDHCYPPERGYAYVGVSRFRTKQCVYHYGRFRRSDWLPVGGDPDREQVARSADSSDDEFADWDASNEDLYSGSESERSSESESEDEWVRGAEHVAVGASSDSDEEVYACPLPSVTSGGGDVDGL